MRTTSTGWCNACARPKSGPTSSARSTSVLSTFRPYGAAPISCYHAPMPAPARKPSKPRSSGNLRIGDQWNAITIIALSQSNPLKAVAELVENSIDARAKNIVITRGKERGQHYLRVKDDGEGVRKDSEGAPDFHYVATHVCDSVKRHLKAQGTGGLQGEFGIGLLSFWTLGEELTLSSTGSDGHLYHMHLRKGNPSYRISQRPALIPEPGTDVLIK